MDLFADQNAEFKPEFETVADDRYICNIHLPISQF